MKDYVPFMDKHPELLLVPTTSVNVGISNFQRKFDYVQNLDRKGDNGRMEKFHLLVKDEKYGVLFRSYGLFNDVSQIVLPAVFDSISFLYKRNKAFGAIVCKNGKYGLFFWEYGIFKDDVFSVPEEYDSMAVIENNRIKGIKSDVITYFDETGHVLK